LFTTGIKGISGNAVITLVKDIRFNLLSNANGPYWSGVIGKIKKQAFYRPGQSVNLTVPSGVTSMTVNMWAIGGNGSNGTGTLAGAGGGSGGALTNYQVPVIADTSVTINIGDPSSTSNRNTYAIGTIGGTGGPAPIVTLNGVMQISNSSPGVSGGNAGVNGTAFPAQYPGGIAGQGGGGAGGYNGPGGNGGNTISVATSGANGSGAGGGGGAITGTGALGGSGAVEIDWNT
jgi:hypothetical protein